jgi:cytochrome c peroxidase
MHNGQFNTLEETVSFYITSSTLAKQGKLRNADPELTQINITGQDVDSLVAFLKALNEDYD